MKPTLSLDIWKMRLREDCERQGKLSEFSNLGDFVLKLLWETGLDPTVQAIADSGTRVVRVA